MTTHDVRPARPTDEDELVDLLTLAFSKDPVWRWVYPEARSYLANFPPFARLFAEASVAAGAAFLSGQANGAALWLPPDARADDAQLARLFQETIDESRQPEVFGYFGKMEAFHPEETHWYLPITGVDPASQGQGHGGAMLRHALSRCDGAGLPAYLESSSPANVPLYERHGFEVVGEIRGDGAPTMIPMRRPARSS